jgi:putative CocE/NonD family hydrolase
MMRYYEHGVHCGEFFFEEDETRFRLQDRVTGEWSALTPLSAENAPSEFPFDKVFSVFRSFESAWGRERGKVTLPDGWGYRFLEERVLSDGRRAELWALTNRAPLLDLVVADGVPVGALWTNRNGSTVLVEPGWEEATPLRFWSSYPAPCRIRPLEMELAPMRDGVRLATETWLPEHAGPFPVVLMRTPYGRKTYLRAMRYLAERGYALVSQDVRGREESEGDFMPFAHEMSDGEDTLNWLARQPWCDGNIGMVGPSYLGKVQWQAAATGHPNLKALVSQVAAGDSFVDSPRPEGAFSSGFLAWLFMMSERTARRDKMTRDDWQELLRHRPIRDIPERALGYSLPFWDEWMKHPDRDAFWRREDWSIYGDRIDVPALLISGWYDDDGMGTTQAWEMNAARGRRNQRMLLGPWLHNYNTTRSIHGVEFGLDCVRYDIDVLVLRWFDRFLKGLDNGVDREPPVEYYEVGSDRWRVSSAWPPAEVQPALFYLHSEGRANSAAGDGRLSTEAPGSEPWDGFVYDPQNPVPQLITMEENEMAVPENYKDIEERPDILVYTTEPLTKETVIAGDVRVVLYAASDAPDTDWLARLTDVDEEGNSIRLADRLVCARYRNSFEKPEPLEAGAIVRYEIRLTRIANAFRRGHRIRLQICSSASRLAFPNPNTGGSFFDETEFRVARQRVFHEKQAPSHVILPLMP